MNTTITSGQDDERTADYIVGYVSGTGAAHQSQDRDLSDADLIFVARTRHMAASKTVVLDQEQFVAGWIAGYRDYFKGTRSNP